MKKNPNKIIPIKQDRIMYAVIFILLLIIGIVVLYPLYFIFIASFSDPVAVNNGDVILFPKGISLVGYEKILQDKRIWSGYFNTIIYTVFGTLFGTSITLLAAYPLSRPDFRGKNIFMWIFLFTMYFSGGLVPLFLQVNKYGLYNTRLIIIILGGFSAYNLIIAKTFFQSNIPKELYEAAAIDGCGNGRFFFQMVLPLSKAIIAVIALYIGVTQWNQYFNSLIFLKDADQMPLQIVLRNILIQNQMVNSTAQDYANMQEREMLAEYIKYGVVVVSSLPVLVVYPFLQKYFVQGVTIGSVKG